MAKRQLPSQTLLRQLLRYDPATGKLFWLPRGPELFSDNDSQTAVAQSNAWNGRNSGREAFTASDGKGYLQGQVAGYHTTAHRVVWAWLHDEWPACLDHIDGNGLNNKEANLRSVSLSENGRNSARNDNSEQMGVRWHKWAWEAYITDAGKQRYLGRYPTKEAATKARLEAERSLGFHPNHGRQIVVGRRRAKRGVA